MCSFVSDIFHLAQDFGESSRTLHLSVVGMPIIKVSRLEGEANFEVEERSGQ